MSTSLIETIPVPVLLDAYAHGRFPMCHDDGELYWHEPDPRAVFPLDKISPNARLRRAIRSSGFTTTIDRNFEFVIHACADREETWIDERLLVSYMDMHFAGHAHSVETWSEGEIIGGVYGVSLGAAFFGESMFSKRTNAGKTAFYALAEHLRSTGCTLFDTQYINDHTASLGAIEITRSQFLEELEIALRRDHQF